MGEPVPTMGAMLESAHRRAPVSPVQPSSSGSCLIHLIPFLYGTSSIAFEFPCLFSVPFPCRDA